MARYAQVQQASGFVTNVFEWDPEAAPGLTPPAGYTFVADPEVTASPGFTYDGTAFVPPPAAETQPG